MPPRTLLSTLALVVTLAGWQPAKAIGPVSSSVIFAGDGRLDLAAMALARSDLPAGYALLSERYDRGEEATSEAEAAAAGLGRVYQSWYATPNEQDRIVSYLHEHATPEGARAGFELLRDGTPNGPPSDLGVGEQPSRLWSGTVESSGDDLPRRVVDARFRLGRLVAGVRLETVHATMPDERLARELAARLAERIELVVAGTPPVGIDLALGSAFYALN